MNRNQLKTSAKTVLHKNFFAAILFILVFHIITGRLGAEIALLFTLIKFEPSYTLSAEEQIGFTGNVFLSNTATIASIIAVVLLLAVYSIFLIGPLTVAKANFFLKARTDSFKTNYIFDVFKDDSYGNILKAMAVRNMIIILGSLLIFPRNLSIFDLLFCSAGSRRQSELQLERYITNEQRFNARKQARIIDFIHVFFRMVFARSYNTCFRQIYC